MTGFLFSFSDSPHSKERLWAAGTELWGEVSMIEQGSFRIVSPIAATSRDSLSTPFASGCINGYARCSNLRISDRDTAAKSHAHNIALLEELVALSHWPLDDSWTGSFAVAAFSHRQNVMVLCNDPLGYYPLYFARDLDGLVGGTTLIGTSRLLDLHVDPLGVLQRIVSPWLCNFGRRTPLEGVERLLPGECIRFAGPNHRGESHFDNTMCGDTIDGSLPEVAELVWECLKNEVECSVDDAEPVWIGLSGGWDSRLLLGALQARPQRVRCVTYGDAALYESQLAARCAKAVGVEHMCYPIDGRYIPSRAELERLVLATESVGSLAWNAILGATTPAVDNQLFMTGDTCESIDGRGIGTFSTRSARRQAFLGGLVGRQESYVATSEEAVESWLDKLTKRIILGLESTKHQLSPMLVELLPFERIEAETRRDLRLSFARVSEQLPKSECMLDELFVWLHNARYRAGSQVLLLNAKFRSLSPPSAMRFLRLISRVHPRLRLRRRLMDAIASLPPFAKLAAIPSAQIPFLPATAPTFLREMMWAARSGTDQFLIKRMMHARNPSARQRVLRSLDYTKEYRRPEALGNVYDWFAGPWMNREEFAGRVRRRAQLEDWPLTIRDVAIPANISILLDNCRCSP